MHHHNRRNLYRNSSIQNHNNNYSEVTTKDLISFGMIPEFVGRFPNWVSLQNLSKEDMLEILTNVKNNYIQQYQWLFDQDSIALEFTDDALEQIAENTMSNHTGARGLHSELDRVLMPHMYHIKQYAREGIKTIRIDRHMVNIPEELKKSHG